MLRFRRSAIGVIVLIVALAAWATSAAGSTQQANPRATLMADFQKRVDDYLELRKKVEATLPPPKPTNNTIELTRRQQQLAVGVRMARATARPGELFGTELAGLLRETISADFAQRSPEQRAAAVKEVPSVRLAINRPYPASIPLATVPPKLLAALPRLPDGLEYRFVARRLVLHDTVTNLVVDYMDDALPQR